MIVLGEIRREVGQWVFPVPASSSQDFLIIGLLVLGSQPTSERLALIGRGQITSHIPILGSFHTQVSPVPFPELRLSFLILFCQEVLIPGPFPSLTSWFWAWPPSFTKAKVMIENAAVVPRSQRGGQKALVQPLTALYRGQEGSTTGKIVGKIPSCPQVPTVLECPVPWEGQPGAAGRHKSVSVSDRQ